MSSNHSLQNLDNYNSEYGAVPTEMFAKYVGLLTEYLVRMVESVSIRSDEYFNFVVIKGIEVISHIFRMLLMYTRNVDLTYYHCHKAFAYYIEFIGQIGDDHHAFLQLNSKDASLFVYKKTIFDLNTEYKKEFTASDDDTSIIECIFLLTELYSSSLKGIISGFKYEEPSDRRPLLSHLHDSVKDYTQNLMDLSIGQTSETFGEKLGTLDQFWGAARDQLERPVPIMEVLAKKLRKQKVSSERLISALMSQESAEKLRSTTLSPARYVTWLCSESNSHK